MHILLSNDDGYNAPGLLHLLDSLKEQAYDVTVVAPKENKSGCGQSLSLRKDIRCEKHENDFYIIDGTPADCVYIGTHCLVKKPVDLVISGINNGANLADDIHYSGTFAAAMEARRLRLPSMSVSIIEHDVQHYPTASRVVTDLLENINNLCVNEIAVLNINIPDMPYEQLNGYKATHLGRRGSPVEPSMSKISNEYYYRLGPAGDFIADNADHLYDFQAVQQGSVSITPVTSQLQHRPYIAAVQQWLADDK